MLQSNAGVTKGEKKNENPASAPWVGWKRAPFTARIIKSNHHPRRKSKTQNTKLIPHRPWADKFSAPERTENISRGERRKKFGEKKGKI